MFRRKKDLKGSSSSRSLSRCRNKKEKEWPLVIINETAGGT
jgi:hypothetical protein